MKDLNQQPYSSIYRRCFAVLQVFEDPERKEQWFKLSCKLVLCLWRGLTIVILVGQWFMAVQAFIRKYTCRPSDQQQQQQQKQCKTWRKSPQLVYRVETTVVFAIFILLTEQHLLGSSLESNEGCNVYVCDKTPGQLRCFPILFSTESAMYFMTVSAECS